MSHARRALSALILAAVLFGCSSPALAQKPARKQAARTSLVERVGTLGILQLEAESFRNLSTRQKILAYYLSQASVAIDPIIYDQMSRHGLRQKRILEAVVAHPRGVTPAALKKISDYTKLFWANTGNHNTYTSQKFLPDIHLRGVGARGASGGKERRAADDCPKSSRRSCRRTARVVLRPEVRADVHGQEPAGRARHDTGELEQLLRREVTLADLKNFQRAATRSTRASSRCPTAPHRAGLARRHARRERRARPLRRVFDEGNRLSSNRRSLTPSRVRRKSSTALDPLLPHGRGRRTGSRSARPGCRTASPWTSRTASSKSTATRAA